MANLTKSDLLQIFQEYGVVSKKDMPNLLQEYGVVSKKDIAELASKNDLTRLERSLTIKITKSKNDLASRIANVAVARVTTLENFQFA